MKNIIVPAIDRKHYINSLFHDVDNYSDEITETIEKSYETAFNALVCGSADAFQYWNGSNLYIMARSLHNVGKYQLSCFWDRSGEMIPLSDCQFANFEDWKREHLPDGITIELLKL